MSDAFVLEKPPKSICILRLSALGDVCHMVAVVQAIQRYYPQTALTWIIGKTEAALIGDLPGIEFLIFDKSLGLRGYYRIYQQLRNKHFDVLLHAQVALRASLVSLFVRADVRIGYDRARAKDGQWLFTKQHIRAVPQQHVLEGLREFARCLGVPESPFTWNVPVAEKSYQVIADLIPQDAKILVLHPCASNPERNWTVAGYADIAEYAVQRYGLTVVLTGAAVSQDQQLAQAIVSKCKVPLYNLVGKLSLKDCLALLSQATVVIGPDTGPLHMATLYDRPIIGLYACSNPKRTGPYRSLMNCVNAYPAALVKYQHTTEPLARWGQRVHGRDVMAMISHKDVREKLDAVMATIGACQPLATAAP